MEGKDRSSTWEGVLAHKEGCEGGFGVMESTVCQQEARPTGRGRSCESVENRVEESRAAQVRECVQEARHEGICKV